MTEPLRASAAPSRIAATFAGGSLAGKWSYLPDGAQRYKSPAGELYELRDVVWHSQEDDVMSHMVYELVPAKEPGQGELGLGTGSGKSRSGVHGSEVQRGRTSKGIARGR